MLSRGHLRLAVRVLLRRKVFTAISLFGVSCTLATLLVVASLFEGSFGDRKPAPDPATTLGVYKFRMAGEHRITTGNAGFAFLDRYVRTLRVPRRVVMVGEYDMTAGYRHERKYDLYMRRVEPGFWDVTRFAFQEGRPFTVEENDSGQMLAVINATTRRRMFGSESAIGQSFELDGRSFSIVGVVADAPFMLNNVFSDVWVPLGSAATSAYREQFYGGFEALVQLEKPGDRAAAKAELAARLKEVQFPEGVTEVSTGLDTPFEAFSREVLSPDMTESKPRAMVGILGALVIAFLALPSVNLANLAISRALERSAEIGLRKAFGATQRHLIVQILFENVVMTACGALLSLPIAWAVLALLNRSGLLPYGNFGIPPRVFLFGAGVAAVFALLSGLYPAWRLSRLEPAAALSGRSA